MTIPIEINQLTKIYKTKLRRPVVAVESLTFSVFPGEVFGFLGPNGSGKSTTIKMLVGLIQKTSGQMSMFGHDKSNCAARMKIGYLPENPSLYDFLTPIEYLAMVGAAFGMSKSLVTRETERVLTLLDLSQVGKRIIRSFSKGMVQRLGLAQTLLHDPDLYIWDEPMSGLDPFGRSLVKNIMIDLKHRGKTIFFSTHVTADVEAVCDRVAILRSGKLQAIEHVRDILEKGIIGYTVHVGKCDVTGYAVQSSPNFVGIQEAFVPKDELNQFMDLVIRSGAVIHLIEPRRRDLEAFFLEVVQQECNDIKSA
jgi:ABC-2 type transport system ATP-binding protein